MDANKEQIQRVQVAIVMHYQHAVQGVQATAILALPNPKASLVRAHVNFELRQLLTSALFDQLILSISRMHDMAADADGIPSILRLLRNDVIRGAVTAPGCEHYLISAREKWSLLRKNPKYDELRKLRDRTRAHLITQDLFTDPGKQVNLVACANETFAVIEDLPLAQGSGVRGLAWHAARWMNMGSDFWAALAQH